MPCQPHPIRQPARAFTLVETLIAIAIALLLIIGISQIFAIAQRTTSMGTALLGTAAGNRSLQGTLSRDIHAMVPVADAPGMVFASYAAAAFRNKGDFDSATNQNDPTDFGTASPSGGPASQAYSTNSRIHRVDRFCFFARDSFHRQTADSPSLTSSTSSNEGFIWYGHLALPNNPAITGWQPTAPAAVTGGANWYNPGVPDIAPGANVNDNNRFASSWVLGRQVMMLLPIPLPLGTPPRESGFMPTGLPPYAPPYTLNLNPTAGPIATCVDPSGTIAPLFASRYDICYTTINDWHSLLGSTGMTPEWWQQLSGLQIAVGAGGNINIDQRYFANPYPTKPDPAGNPAPDSWNSAAAAQTAPIFVRGCSQFIVEFAGDFCKQNPVTGLLDATNPASPDGQIDFIVDPTTNEHRIRWYGFPRDTATGAGLNTGKPVPDGTIDIYDVIPVSWFSGVARTFERSVPPVTLNSSTMPFTPATAQLPMHSQAYVCGWSAGDPVNTPKPTMMRIIVAVDDVNGRLNGEQTYEYVFTLP